MTTKALLIDGHNFLFRGYHGVPVKAQRSDGTPINAVYGFFSLLRNTSKKINPDYLAIMFDSETSIDKKKETRPEYKANRSPENNSVYCQLPLIKKSLDLLGIVWIEDKEIEADDLIGAYSKMFNRANVQSCIASSDYDFMQLVSENILVARGRHGNVDIYNKPKVYNNFGVLPEQYIDYLALVGDPSDNIKGIKGIGEKRASSLLFKHKNIENVYESFNLLPRPLKKLLNGHKDFLISQREFLRIKKNLKVQNKFKAKDYSFSNDKIPEKMGKFLDDNWKNLILCNTKKT